MGCCGKKIKNIAEGYTNLLFHRKYIFTEKRIRRCKKCIYNIYIGTMLWCRICKCLVAAAARTKKKYCPKGFWERKELPEWAIRKEV